MGRKGKSKGGGGGNTNPPKAEEPKLEVEEVKPTPVVDVKPVVPVVEIPVVVAPTKVDEKVIEKPVEVNELPTVELSNSQKKKNKKNSSEFRSLPMKNCLFEIKFLNWIENL